MYAFFLLMGVSGLNGFLISFDRRREITYFLSRFKAAGDMGFSRNMTSLGRISRFRIFLLDAPYEFCVLTLLIIQFDSGSYRVWFLSY